MPLSRAQFKAKLEETLKEISTSAIRDPISRTFCDAPKSTIDFCNPFGEQKETSVDVPESDDARNYMKAVLSHTSTIFTEEYFRMPLSALEVLRDTADLFGFADVTIEYAKALDLSDFDLKDKKQMLHIWLCQMLELEALFCQGVVTKFKAYRANPLLGSTTSFHPLSSSPTAATSAPIVEHFARNSDFHSDILPIQDSSRSAEHGSSRLSPFTSLTLLALTPLAPIAFMLSLRIPNKTLISTEILPFATWIKMMRLRPTTVNRCIRIPSLTANCFKTLPKLYVCTKFASVNIVSLHFRDRISSCTLWMAPPENSFSTT